MNFGFHGEARAEFFDAIRYYESSCAGTGQNISREVMAAVSQILLYPLLWPFVPGFSVRRCLLHRFPYAVIYSVEPDRIYVLAVMHLHRHPDYWRHRLTE